MRVAVVSMDTPATDDSRALRRTRRVAEGLADRGHDVVWLCARWWDGEGKEFLYRDVRYRAVTDGPAAGAFRSKLPFSLRRVDPTVVHATNVPPTHATTAATTCRLLRTPVVVDWWETDGDRGSAGQYRKAARKADRVTVPSETVKTAVREHDVPAEDVCVLPESVAFETVRSAGVDDRADVVYMRDPIDGDANVESFLLALAELRDRDWRAAVIGDGSGQGTARQSAADLRIDDRVEFLGALEPAEFVPILKGAHVFAQTATREPFADGLLWALACGCVGIVEYQAGSSAHELVENVDRGRLVTNPQELADEIVACADEPHETINETFSGFADDAVLDEYVATYETVVDERGLF